MRTLTHKRSYSEKIVDTKRVSTNSRSVSREGDTYVHGIWRIVYVALAVVFLAIGILGIVLPGLPTTPFLLLTSYFLARSSPSLHRKFLANRFFGHHIRLWQEHRAVDPSVKIRAALLVGLSIALLIGFTNLSSRWLVAVVLLACVGLIVIYRLPTQQDVNYSAAQ